MYLLCRVSGVPILTFCASVLLCGQAEIEKQRPSTVSVPFVGCDSDGQVGPINAPAATAISVLAKPEEAEKLAYYKSEKGVGVLAGDSGEAERYFRRETERHSGMNPNTIGA
jgi:hypothetical protein